MSFEREINSIHVFFYLLFLFSFFKNQPKTNLLTKGLKWLLYYYIFIMIVNYSLKFMLSDIYFLERNMIIGLIGSVSIGILSTIFIFRIPTIDSTLIGIGFTLYLIGMGVTVYFVYGNSMLPNNFWIENPNIFYLLGILGELFFFSLALSFRNNATIKKQQNEKNELQNRHQINLAKTKLYTNITHEFRTPLTVILGLTEQIRINPKFKLKERLQIIKGNGHRLLKLINELLDLSKLDSGNMLLSYKQGNIIAFLGFLCNSFKNLASAKHIHLTYYAEESALIMDYDEEKLQQIISNLLHNAIKFTAEYGEITLAVKKIEQSLQISVQDNGFGIPFDKQAKIFDRFYQINSAYIQENDGTGIGLALVKELVLLMKGEINIFSEPEKGTTFIITLPILNKAPFSAEHSTEMTAISSVSNEFPAQNKVIFKELPLLLLVEDNADVVYFLKNCLNSKYETIIAKDGQEGFELAKEFLPDLIITDIMMPKINGFELTQLLKADDSTKDIPILISTAKATRKDRLKGLKLGAIEYIFKPFSQEELLIGVEKALKFGGSNKELEKRNALPTEEMVFIEKLYQTVEENLEKEAFNTHDLAKAMMMSRTQLYRKTKAYNNQSPSFLIRKIRLEKAQNLLIDSNLSIGRIAQQTGFRDQSYFTKVFSKVYHLTPSEYRNNNKKTTV
jgi:signal transduction histidine kinase/DNA-binding response OmpR family regulator